VYVFGRWPERGGRLLPVSIYTVARELRHQSDEMVKPIHAHLDATRHRSSVVEYRLAQPGGSG